MIKKFLPILLISGFLVALPAVQAVTVSEGKQGPHGGMIVNLDEGRFEIVIDEKAKTVDVYAIEKPKQPLQYQMSGIRLTQKGSKTEAYLKAADPWKGLPHYRGAFPSGAQPGAAQTEPALGGSRAGLEVEIRWKK